MSERDDLTRIDEYNKRKDMSKKELRVINRSRNPVPLDFLNSHKLE
ncbi:hypothetical protein [Methanosarcina horonobensis]|nr:hypothetical protein [Methanosarcina horonobensis]